MLLFDRLVERRIEAAIAAGELDDLPGAGKPLDLDDDRLVPEALRVAHRILKNAGFYPPEVDTLREIANVEDLLRKTAMEAPDDASRRRAVTRLALLEAKLEAEGRSLPRGIHRDRIVGRVGRQRNPASLCCSSDPKVTAEPRADPCNKGRL